MAIETGFTRGIIAVNALLALTLAVPAAADDWQGSMVVVETLSGPGTAAGERAELEELTKTLEERLAQTREQLKSATPFVARVLREDVGELDLELERLALERGGSVTLGRSIYILKGARLVVDGDEAKVVADRMKATALVIAAGRREEAALQPPPELLPLASAAPSKAVAGYATRQFTIKADGQGYTVLVAPELPNPYAIGLLTKAAANSLETALAALPGMPMLVEGKSGSAIRRWTVQRVQAGEVDEAVFAQP